MERVYRLEPSPPAETFFIEGPTVRKYLGPSHPLNGAEEVVVMVRRGPHLRVGLYFEKSLRRRISFSQNLTFHQLATLIEGISHLLLILDRCRRDSRLSQLELELQAEVDKFLFLRLAESESLRQGSKIHLEAEANLKGLDSSRKNTYETARRLANRYCRHLEETYLGSRSMDPLWEELRGFYRMSHWKKLNVLP
jgi:hypothetical protein